MTSSNKPQIRSRTTHTCAHVDLAMVIWLVRSVGLLGSCLWKLLVKSVPWWVQFLLFCFLLKLVKGAQNVISTCPKMKQNFCLLCSFLQIRNTDLGLENGRFYLIAAKLNRILLKYKISVVLFVAKHWKCLHDILKWNNLYLQEDLLGKTNQKKKKKKQKKRKKIKENKKEKKQICFW